MLLKESLRQTGFLLKQREAGFTLTVLFWIVLWNYLRNVVTFQGLDVSQMYEPVKLLTLSYNKTYYDADTVLLFTMLYPLLVPLAAGLSYAKERQTKEELYLTARLGKKHYMQTKLLSVFLTTVLVFTLPFFVEILITCVSFPSDSHGDLTNLSIYSQEYAEMVHRYPTCMVYMVSPVLYAVLGTFLFGICSGIMAAFTTAVSFCFSIKYRVVLFFPSFLLLNSTLYLNELFSAGSCQISWYEYLLLFNDNRKFCWYLPAAAAFLFLAVIGLYEIGKRQERYG